MQLKQFQWSENTYLNIGRVSIPSLCKVSLQQGELEAFAEVMSDPPRYEVVTGDGWKLPSLFSS